MKNAIFVRYINTYPDTRKSMKKSLCFLFSLLLSLPLIADEGMWLPSLISQRIQDMQAKGFKLDANDIYSINQASLKDAVVLFGRGCTGELISDEGLLLTNHHCGYGQIQYHSSVEHDYLKDGFWAMTRDEELPNPGLSVSFLDRMEDVTNQVLVGTNSSMNDILRDSIIRSNSKRLIRQATAEGNGLRATVEAMYYGNQYFLFVYREFRDVRLVGAPPSSIGKFGGDTDNWMWPRHTGDFSIFRIYADANNNPAEYAADNVPYQPKRHFKISLKGVKEGDFTFVYGFPGSTREYIHSSEVHYIAEVSNPHKIKLRTLRLDIQKRYMDADQAVRIQYSSKNAGVANAWKKWQGEMKGIRKMNTISNKKVYEKRFQLWARGTRYAPIVNKLDSLYQILEPYSFATDYYNETVRTVELIRFAQTCQNTLNQHPEDLANQIEAFYKDYYLPIDKDCFVAIMNEYHQSVPDNFKPEYYQALYKKHGSIEAWAEHLFSQSVFIDRERTAALTPQWDLSSDPALEMGIAFQTWYNEEILPVTRRIQGEIRDLYSSYMRGQMEYEPLKAFYPDANLTLRVAYGKIQGYSPSDGVYFQPVSTVDGIMEKDNPNIFDYNIPQRLRDIYATKDYGRWAENGRVPVCFIADNHTSGGNSGSPVINAEGHLIGLNFDRVWEGTMSDIVFDPEVCRNISLDIRYVLFIIDKVADADHLLEEMDFVE